MNEKFFMLNLKNNLHKTPALVPAVKELLVGAASFGEDENCSGEAGQELTTIPSGANVAPAEFLAS